MRRRRNRRYNRSRPKIPNFLLRIFFTFLFLVLTFAPLLLVFRLRGVIARSDPGVIASWDTASLFWCMPLLFYLLVTLGVLFSPWVHRIPVRHRERPCYGIEATKRRRKVGAILWSIGFVFVLLLSLLSLSGRECLTRDGRLQKYNMFNQLVEEYTVEDVTEIRLKTIRERSGRYGGYHYDYAIYLYVEDEHFYFESNRFFLSEYDTLQELLSIREHYEPHVTIETTAEQLEKVVRDRKLTEEETELLYTLFAEKTPDITTPPALLLAVRAVFCIKA